MGGSIPTNTDLLRKDVKGRRYWFSNITEAYDFDLSSLYTNLKARVRTDSRSIEHQASAELLSRPLELCRTSPLRPFIVCRALGIERLHVNGDFECMSSTA